MYILMKLILDEKLEGYIYLIVYSLKRSLTFASMSIV